MTTARMHYVTMRHPVERFEYVTTRVELTDEECEQMLAACRADGSHQPGAPLGKRMTDLPSEIAIESTVVNVRAVAAKELS